MNESTTMANDADIQQWVAQLSDFRTRRVARQKLTQAKAIPALIECLKSRNESVVWSAVRSLDELQAQEAVPELLALMHQEKLVSDVSTALEGITGKKFGVNVAAWKRWQQEESGEVAEELENIEAILKECSGILKVEPTVSENVYEYTITVDGGRTQTVSVMFGQQDADGDEVVIVYSPCAPAAEKYFDPALRMNFQLTAGAIAIRDIEEQPHLVMVDALLIAALHPLQLSKSIEQIAHRADMLEARLTNKDKW